MADDKPIIIIKKKGGHGGHHGGAWKVAYADFVTAMMAFFMVMWLVNSASSPTKQNIANYFRKPGIFDQGSGTPLMIGEGGILNDMPPPTGSEKGKKGNQSGEAIQYKKKSGTEDIEAVEEISIRGEDDSSRPLPDKSEDSGLKTDSPGDELARSGLKQKLEEIAEEIQQQIAMSPELSELLGVVDIKVDANGLNIEIMDTDKSSMFASGSASVAPEARMAFHKITQILRNLNSSIEIVGHTDAKPFSNRPGGYSNWELSADRANAARRILEDNGISSERITSVVGRAEKDIKYPENPLAPGNRRITMKMKFDFTKSVNVARDPQALDKIPQYQKEYEDKIQQLAEDKKRKKEEERIHALTAKEILEKKEKGIIVLPQQYDKKQEELTHSKDKIFGDSPVLKLPDVIYGE